MVPVGDPGSGSAPTWVTWRALVAAPPSTGCVATVFTPRPACLSAALSASATGAVATDCPGKPIPFGPTATDTPATVTPETVVDAFVTGLASVGAKTVSE